MHRYFSELNCLLTIGLPEPDELPGDNKKTLYFILCDYIFAIGKYLMKPLSIRYLEPRQKSITTEFQDVDV